MKIDHSGYEYIRDRIKSNVIQLKLTLEEYGMNALNKDLEPMLDDLDDIVECMKNKDEGWEIRSSEDAFD